MHAQTWQWAEQGGSVAGFPNNQSLEDVVDMLVDEHGNVYILALVNGDADPKIGDQVFTGYGSMDIMLASFACDGSLRWAKTIGGQNTDAPFALGIDSLNQIYVYGRVTATVNPQFGQTPVHIDTDSILDWTRKSRFFAIYDTTGSLNNFHMYEPDTFDLIPSANLAILSRDFSVAPNGDIYLLGYIQRAEIDYGNGFYIETEGWYILRYEQGHILADVIPLEIELERMSYGNFNHRFTRDHQTGNFYVSGTFNTLSANHPLIIGGDTINTWAVAAAFNAEGEYLWHRTNSNTQNNRFLYGRPLISNNGNLIFSGRLAPNDVFAGYTLNNLWSTSPSGNPFIAKLDNSGNLEWGNHAWKTVVIPGKGSAISNNMAYIGRSFAQNIKFQYSNDTLTSPQGTGYQPFVAGFNLSSGIPVFLDNIETSIGAGVLNTINEMITDHRGNLFVGGTIDNTFFFNDTTTLHNSGAGTDWFIAKYGYPCDCDAPNADFSFEIDELDVTFTLAEPAGLLTVNWVFGDGNTSESFSPVHWYNQPGTYIVCVDVENDCGTRRFCDRVSLCLLPDPQFSYTTSETGATLHLSIPDTSATAVVWDFGDGQTGAGLQVSHTYAEEGTYEICATVTSPCGTETHCEEITIQFVSTIMPDIFSEVNIFPNPAKDMLHLHNLPEGTQYRLYSIIGREIYMPGSLHVLFPNTMIDVSHLPSGSYILRLITDNQVSRNFLIQVGG